MSTDASMLPQDEFNQRLLEHVHPINWVNRTEAAYHLASLAAPRACGQGSGGPGALRAACSPVHGGSASISAVCSKAILRASGLPISTRDFGIEVTGDVRVFAAVMQRAAFTRRSNDSARGFRDLESMFFLAMRVHWPGSPTVGDRILVFAERSCHRHATHDSPVRVERRQLPHERDDLLAHLAAAAPGDHGGARLAAVGASIARFGCVSR